MSGVPTTGNTTSGDGAKAAGYTEAEQKINESPEDIINQSKGHKANLSNKNTSEESKQSSREWLKAHGQE
ncbi:hypothetical protein GQ43DRAFT_437465 [Delitschia confertaspora ATCC 74209]|uniref:Uncharacterized protein n=1 Tax=Delitschia confertaspora ATCC 74209 TaxID=1513339 RepID=A0A9P4MZ52_9PLEO|nr:hypothetical protein GQ43DRAFT_437465 [Delitschia confertaspora ATCC 74209]